jgi:hypothetical protein
MTTWPAPIVPVFPAGYDPQQADFTTWWYDVASFLQNRVVARVSQTTTATTLPSSGANTTIAYDTVAEDPYSGWNAAAHAWGPPAGYSGWYEVTITVRTAAVAANVDLYIGLGGTYTEKLASVLASAGGGGAECVFAVYLTGGQDTVTAMAELLNSGSNVNTNLTAGQQSTMEIVWLSQS